MRGFYGRLAGLAALTVATAWLAGPWIDSVPFPVCLFKAVTGRPCIFCGMTHALAHAVRGRWDLAASAHPIWWLILPIFLLAAAAIISRRAPLGWSSVGLVISATLIRAWM